MNILGIDIGTTSISAVVLDPQTKQLNGHYTIESKSFLESENAFEKIQDPVRIMEKVKQLLSDIRDSEIPIAAIGLTGQMHGIVYYDAEGKAVSPLYTWQDQSGNEPVSDGESICDLILKTCGYKVYTGYGAATYLFHVHTGQVPKTAVGFCTIMDYLGMVLTGRKKALVHISNAASFGLFDIGGGVFDTKAFEAMGADVSLLPGVTKELEVLGTYEGIPVITAIGDNQASFLGTVTDPDETVLVNMGTGAQVSVYSNQYYDIEGIEARPLLKDSYILAGSALCGGRAYAMLKDFFAAYTTALGIEEADHYKAMAKLLVGRRKEEALVVDTRFSGTRDEPDIRGSITQIGTDNFTPSALIYGVLDGMAQELYDGYHRIRSATGEEKKLLLASGNGMRKNPALQKRMSEKFGLPVRLATQEEEAAFGAALTGYMGAFS